MSSRFRGAILWGAIFVGCYLVGCYLCGVLSLWGAIFVGCYLCGVLSLWGAIYWWGATGGALLVGNGTRTRFGVAPLLDTSSSRMPLHA